MDEWALEAVFVFRWFFWLRKNLKKTEDESYLSVLVVLFQKGEGGFCLGFWSLKEKQSIRTSVPTIYPGHYFLCFRYVEPI